jgi:hypothetical protein
MSVSLLISWRAAMARKPSGDQLGVPTILVLEDEGNHGIVLQDNLRESGYLVLEAHDESETKMIAQTLLARCVSTSRVVPRRPRVRSCH